MDLFAKLKILTNSNMKNYIRILLIQAITFLMASCSQEIVSTEQYSTTRAQDCEADTTLRLEFQDEEELRTMILSDNKENKTQITTYSDYLPVPTIPSNFVSLMSPMQSSDNGIETTYYEALGYDSLVPNVNFAKLLNIQGEMLVSNEIVKITEDGTYIVPRKYEQEFRTFLKNKNNIISVNSIDGITFLINNHFKFIKTFEQNNNDYSTLSLGNYCELPDDFFEDEEDIENITTMTRSSASEPSFNDFATFSADKKTVLGKIIQNLIGSTKAHTINYNKKLRLKGSFYFYNYGVYSEIGVKGWTDRKRTFNWTKTTSDELRVGWRNVILDVPMTDELKNNLSGNLNVAYSEPHQMYVGHNPVNTATLIDPNISSSFWEKVKQKGVKAIIEYIKSTYDSSKTKNLDKAEAFIIATPTELKFVVPDDDIIKYDIKSYCHTFSEEWYADIIIGWNNTDGIFLNKVNSSNANSIRAWIDTIVKILTTKHTTLVCGEVYVCSRFGNEWRGMKIIKKEK